MVFSLAFALSPVATADPGSNKWSQFPTPLQGSDGDYILLDNLDYLGPMEMSIDGDIWVAALVWEPDAGEGPEPALLAPRPLPRQAALDLHKNLEEA